MMNHYLRCLVSALLLLTPISLVQASGDPWVFALAWSPQYCRDNPASKEPQCTEPHFFVPLFLRKDYGGGATEKCDDSERVPRDDLNQLYPVVPNRVLIRRIWRDYGACSGYSQDEYFLQLDRARRRIQIPDQWREVTESTRVDRNDFLQTFLDVNPGLPRAGIRLECSRGSLAEVHVCLDANFDFRGCGPEVEGDCKDRFRIKHLRLMKR